MGGVRTLIVDDHAVVRMQIRELLARETTIEVIGEAADGEEAIHRVEQLRPDLILMDVGLPGTNGIEVTRRVMASAPHTFIVMLSLLEPASYCAQAAEAGASGCVSKHRMRAELIPTLKALLPHSEGSDPGTRADIRNTRPGQGQQMAEVEITTRTSRIRLGEDGIVRVVVLPDAEQTLEDAKEQVAAVQKVAQGKKRPVLVDARDGRFMDRAARVYYASDEAARFRSASALLVGSAVTRVMASFFLGLNKPNYPVRLFNSENEALDWLRGFLE